MVTVPNYRRLADELRAAIDSGTYPVGSKLPKITDLAEERGLSLATVRSAYRTLAREGVVAVVRRGGTVVLPSPRRVVFTRYRPGDSADSWERAAAGAGLTGTLRDLGDDDQPAPPDVASALDVAPGSLLRCRRWVALLDGAPHHFEELWTTGASALGEYLDVVGGRAVERVSFRSADRAESAALDAPAGGALAVVDRLTLAEDGTPQALWRIAVPVERAELLYNGLSVTHGIVET